MSTTGWAQGRVDALLSALDTYGMVMSRAAAEDLITERVGSVAQLMRTTKATARHYLTDEAIAGMAESIAFSLAEEESPVPSCARHRALRPCRSMSWGGWSPGSARPARSA